MTIQQLKAHFHKGKMQPWAWPGGYPLYAVTSDGAALCPTCITKNRAQIFRATHEWHNREHGARVHCGWAIEGIDANWEDASLYCDNCSKRIESAYAEDEAVQDAPNVYGAQSDVRSEPRTE